MPREFYHASAEQLAVLDGSQLSRLSQFLLFLIFIAQDLFAFAVMLCWLHQVDTASTAD